MEGRILQLISALRASGVRVSLAESADAFLAINSIGIMSRSDFRLSLRATLIKDVRSLPVFDQLFPLFFGSGEPPQAVNDFSQDLSPDEARKLAEILRQIGDRLRQNIERLLNGTPLSRDELEQLAKMVGLNNIQDLGYRNWMTQRMERALAFPEVRATINQILEQLQQMGMGSQRLKELRTLLKARLDAFHSQLDQFAGERIAENLSQRGPVSGIDEIGNRPFQNLSEEEMRQVLREVKRISSALRTRIALRQKRAKTGQLDAKATIRANLKHHGIPMVIRHKDQAKKPKIVVICDVSTSMRFCSQLMLSFIYELQGLVRKTHAFAFIDHLEYISNEFTGKEGSAAISSILERMPSGSYNTDLGQSLENFNHDYLETLNSNTTLIVVGDGRNNYNDPHFEIFDEMSRRAVRTLWFNPEQPELWGTGDSDMPGYAGLCDTVLKVSNLAELASAIDQLMTS